MRDLRFLATYIFIILFSIRMYASDSVVVYIFLLESCPICQQQTAAINELHDEFKTSGITFIGLFPNARVSNHTTIDSFAGIYGLSFELKMDSAHYYKEKFSATITPEVFVVDHRTQKLLYTGKIDNRFESVGVRRQVVSEFYLRDALNEILNNEPVSIASTPPVGCLIMRKPQ